MLVLLKMINWKYAAVALATAAAMYYVYSSKSEIYELKLQGIEKEKLITKLNGELKLSNELVLRNKTEYAENLKTISEKKSKTEIVYKERVQAIYKWSDGNATCDSAVDYLNNYAY